MYVWIGWGFECVLTLQTGITQTAQTMISSMMSSQTTDIVNEGAMRRLQEACGITIEGLEALGEECIAAIIKPVSFYTPKAQNILKVRWEIDQRDWGGGGASAMSC